MTNLTTVEGQREFQEDWDKAMGHLRVLAAKHGLSTPELILHPMWRGVLRATLSLQHQLVPDGNISRYMDVKLHFGKLEQGVVLR